jgi:adenylate kinase
MNLPRVPGICDVDGSTLVQRADDNPETIRARLASQLDDLSAVVEHYRATGALRTVNGLRPIDEVSAALIEALAAGRARPS